MAERTETEVALAATREADLILAEARVVCGDGVPYLVLPEDLTLHDMEPFLPAPLRIREDPVFQDAVSFGTYVQSFRQPGTVLFGSREKGTVTALIDYHEPAGPSRNTHKATLQLAKSHDWQAWSKLHNAPIGQVQFAEFLEDNLDVVQVPKGAEVLELARFFQVKREVVFESARNLQNGAVQLKFHEDEQAGGGAGNTTVPPSLTLRLRVYEGGPQYDITARLRYDLDRGGKLTFKLVLAQLSKVLERAFGDVCQAVAETLEMPILQGTP